MKDLKDIRETLKANSEISHGKYPTPNPIKEGQPLHGSDKISSKISSQHQFDADDDFEFEQPYVFGNCFKKF